MCRAAASGSFVHNRIRAYPAARAKARQVSTRQTVADRLAVLAAAQPPAERRTATGEARRTAVLAVLRGAMLDLLATGDLERTTAAVRHQLRAAGPAAA